jgi:hypothetical protein
LRKVSGAALVAFFADARQIEKFAKLILIKAEEELEGQQPAKLSAAQLV